METPPNTRQTPLSAAQQRLWVLEQLHPRKRLGNVGIGLRWTGALDPEALESALHEALQRHEIMRCEFRSIDGTPMQVLSASARVVLAHLDLQHLRELDRANRVSDVIGHEIAKAFDPQQAPLLRATHILLSASEHVVLLIAHRMVCDEASLRILANEIALNYDAGVTGGVPEKPEVLQYREVASRPIAAGDLSYWKERLAGAPSSLDLPTDRVRPATQSFQGASQTMRIDGALAQKLRELSQKHDVTLFVTIMAALQVLLARCTRQDDLVIGTRASGRVDPESRAVVGPLENMLALRTEVAGNRSFAEFLSQLRQVVEDAFAHQRVPFELLLSELRLDRDMSRHPLFQVRVDMQESVPSSEIRPGTTVFEIEDAAEQFDLRVEFRESAGGLDGRFSYSTDLFDEATIVRMMEHFRILLESAAADPSVAISKLPMLGEAERNRVLVDWNDTKITSRKVECIHQFFEEQVERTPDALAVTCNGASLSYRELNERANRLAHYLKKRGAGPEVLIGICAERSIEILVGILGILKAGGAYVPLDPAYPKDRLAVILEDAKARMLLTQKGLTEILPPGTEQTIFLDSNWPEMALEPATNPECSATSENLDYVLFTSGSTGRPKGVAIEHRSGVTFIQWAQQVFLHEEVAGTLFSTSVCFDLSVFEMFVPLSMGGTVIIVQNALALPRLQSARDVTLINTVPSAIAELVRGGSVPQSVRVVNLAGEALHTPLAQQIYERTQVSKVYNLYGPTEDTTYSTYTLVPRGGDVTIGKPLPNTQVYILDANQQPVPIGIPGELYLAGDGLARGYFGRKDLTDERFVPNPFPTRPGDRMYRTGDLARFLADGNIQYMGRIDSQVKVRGFRIELEEIENLLRRDPSVQAAVVIAREDIPGDKRLVAYVVPSGKSISVQALQKLIREKLPEYMMPTAFIELKQLPLSPNGKINRRLLPAPEGSGLDNATVVQPRDELEAKLLEIWQNVLRISNFGVRDDFFSLGGHSLTAMRVLAEVEEVTGRELPLSALFRGSTVESLARLVRELDEIGDPVVLEIQHGDSSPVPFFAIVPPAEESLGYAMLARHMGPEQTVYKVQGHAPVTMGKRPYSEQEMRALVGEYTAAMRSVQPHGPYCLGGLCDGTHIAEQIVLKLESEGEEIGLFAIFDTWVLQHSQNRFLWKIHYYGERVRQLRKLSMAERLSSYKRVAEKKVQKLVGSNPARTDWRQTYWPEDFTPTRFRAPVVLFKRPRQPFYYINDSQMGWGERSQGGVTIHEVDFHHAEILREPHVKVFGKELAAHMAELNASFSMSHNESLAGSVPEQQGA